MDWLVQKLDHAQDKYYESEYHDRVIRSILNFKTPINWVKFENTVKKMIDIVPILNSVLVDHGHTITWHSRVNYSGIVNVLNNQKMFLSSFLKPIDETKEAQIRISVWGSSIGFAVNNMLMDVYALRDLVCLFVDLYKNIDNPVYVSKYANVKSRNIYKFFQTVKCSHKHFLWSLGKLKTDGHNKYTLPIPPQDQNVTNRWLITETIPVSEVTTLKQYADLNKTTLEDVMLGAYHKALASTLQIEGEPFCIGRFFNARSYSKHKPYISWNNLHAVLPYSFKTVTEEDFVNTIKEVDKISDFIAKNHLVIKKCIKETKKDRIHDDFFLFAYVRVMDNIKINEESPEIMFSMAARNVPYMGITFTECDETVRICAVNYVDDAGIKIVDYIVRMIHYYLQLLIYQINNGEEINFSTNTHGVLDVTTASEVPAATFDLPAEQNIAPATSEESPSPEIPSHKTKKVIHHKSSSHTSSKSSHSAHHTHTASTNKKSHPIKSTPAHSTHSSWTAHQHALVAAFKKYHGETLVPVDGEPNKVKYLIKGKNTYQKRTWAEVEKFVEFKQKSKK